MQLSDFQPENEVEFAVVDTKNGVRTIDELIDIVADADLYISSKAEVQRDWSGFDPLLLEESGNPLVAAFSSPSRPSLHRDMAEYILQIKGREFLLRLPPRYGVVLNPGYITQLIISPTALSDLKNYLQTKRG